MTAPSIKEALERARRYVEHHPGTQAQYDLRAIDVALATFQPDGERREAIARIIDPKAFQNDKDGVSLYWSERRTTALADADLILASGLVQNEAGEKVTLLLRMIDAAGGEIDATENVHSLLNYFCDDRGSATDTYNLAIDQGLIGSSFDSMFETSRAWLTDAGRAAIRSARDGGAS